MESKEKKYETGLGTITIVLLIVAILLFLFAPFAPFLLTIPAKDGIGFSETGEIGDTIGGLMSPFINLSAVIVTGLAFYMQYRANKLQVLMFNDQLEKAEKQNKVQQFENHFFEMLRLHKDNVDELKVISVVNGFEVTRRQAFVTMANDFKIFLSYLDLDKFDFLKEYKIAYDIFFWGWDSNYIDVESLSGAWSIIVTGPSGTGADYDHTIDFRNYQGYSSSLGHYFRHLFMMVDFVVYSNVIDDYDDKMRYLKILRAQLSNHEQIMLFYNWLSSEYGGAWENEKNKFFTEFKMIHNLWVDELFENQFIVDKVNELIDRYNKHPRKAPLFEFQRTNFNLKIEKL